MLQTSEIMGSSKQTDKALVVPDWMLARAGMPVKNYSAAEVGLIAECCVGKEDQFGRLGIIDDAILASQVAQKLLMSMQ